MITTPQEFFEELLLRTDWQTRISQAKDQRQEVLDLSRENGLTSSLQELIEAAKQVEECQDCELTDADLEMVSGGWSICSCWISNHC